MNHNNNFLFTVALYILLSLVTVSIGFICSNYPAFYYGKDDGMLMRFLLNSTIMFFFLKYCSQKIIISLLFVFFSLIFSFFSLMILYSAIYVLPSWFDIVFQTLFCILLSTVFTSKKYKV